MGLRLRSIRLRIFLLVLLPILSLIGLYGFATFLTARGALTLSQASTIKTATGLPTGAFLSQVDAERPLAIVYLSAPTGANLAVLQVQQSKTDRRRRGHEQRAQLADHDEQCDAGREAGHRDPAHGRQRACPRCAPRCARRSSASRGRWTRTTPWSSDAYSVLDQAILEQTNASLVSQAEAFVRMGRSEDLMLQESAIISGDLAARSFPAADRQQFTQLVGARRALYNQTLPDLQPSYRAYYMHDISPQAATALTSLENQLMSATQVSSPPPVLPQEWQAAVGGVAAGLSRAGTQASNQITAQASANSRGTYLELFLAGGLGLLAVILSILVSFVIGRGLIRELADLRQSALELANKRLPDVVKRLADGQDVDVSAEAPELPASSDEIGQVRQAFAAVQQTAVEAAVGQARLRQGISDIFRNLARRSQSLLHRQLALLDAMERRAREPEELEDLFRIDHLTTRMRRHAESLIILSGDAPARGWRQPGPVRGRAPGGRGRGGGLHPDQGHREHPGRHHRPRGRGRHPHDRGARGERGRLLPAEHPRADQRRRGRPRVRGGDRGPRARAERGAAGRAQRPAGEPARRSTCPAATSSACSSPASWPAAQHPDLPARLAVRRDDRDRADPATRWSSPRRATSRTGRARALACS